jgi:hypothetical protein
LGIRGLQCTASFGSKIITNPDREMCATMLPEICPKRRKPELSGCFCFVRNQRAVLGLALILIPQEAKWRLQEVSLDFHVL